MKIFISGKISGLDYEEATRRFQDKKEYFEMYHYDVIIPTDLCDKNWNWWKCMYHCLKALKTCDIVYFMDSWKRSKGSIIEYIYANILNKIILTNERTRR